MDVHKNARLTPAGREVLFRAATQTLRTIAADQRHLGAEAGGPFTSGGRAAYLGTGAATPPPCPLHRARRRSGGRREPPGSMPARLLPARTGAVPLVPPAVFAQHLAKLRRADWVVYAKRPFGGPEQVLAYLGRYTHRVAISNS